MNEKMDDHRIHWIKITLEVEGKLEFDFCFLGERSDFRKYRHIYKADYTDMIKSIYYIYSSNASYGLNSSHTKKRGNFYQRLAGLIKEDYLEHGETHIKLVPNKRSKYKCKS